MSGRNDGGDALVPLIRLVFSSLFPIALLTLCGVSWLLAFPLHLPQLGFWASVAIRIFRYAADHAWAGLALAGFGAFALYLAWVGFREHAARVSGAIGGWVGAAIVAGGTIWLATAWPDNGAAFQRWVFGFFLFFAWFAVCEALLSTAKLIAQNRPQPGPEVVAAQKAHGDARIADEAEARALLNSRE